MEEKQRINASGTKGFLCTIVCRLCTEERVVSPLIDLELLSCKIYLQNVRMRNSGGRNFKRNGIWIAQQDAGSNMPFRFILSVVVEKVQGF